MSLKNFLIQWLEGQALKPNLQPRKLWAGAALLVMAPLASADVYWYKFTDAGYVGNNGEYANFSGAFAWDSGTHSVTTSNINMLGKSNTWGAFNCTGCNVVIPSGQGDYFAIAAQNGIYLTFGGSLNNGATVALSVKAAFNPNEAQYQGGSQFTGVTGYATLLPGPIPLLPAAPLATPGNTQATVSWVPPADGGSPITGFSVVADQDSSKTCTASATDTQCDVLGLQNGSPYTFTVYASNVNGDGPASPSSSTVTPMELPAQPTTPTATAGQAQATVSWVAPFDGGGALTGFVVTAVQDAGKTCTGSASDTQCTVPGLTAGMTYTFTVTASNALGSSVASSPSNAVTIPNYPLGITPPSSIPAAIVGQPYSLQLQVSGGLAPYVWTATGLPAGLGINAVTGEISGTPTATESQALSKAALAVTVTVTDSLNVPLTQTFSLTVNPAAAVVATPVPLFSEWWEKALLSMAMLGWLALRIRGRKI